MKKKEREFFLKVLKRQLEELTQKSNATLAGLLNSTANSADPHIGFQERVFQEIVDQPLMV